MTPRTKPSSCIGCQLHSHGTDFSAVEGTGANGVLLVGEASGEHEQRDGLPFRPYAPAGAVLERCIRRMGLAREQFAITNCARCRPRHNWLEGAPWEYAALRHCRSNLDAAVAEYRPRCIVALGGVAVRELTGEAGEARGVTHLAGYCLPLASSKVPCDNCISYDSLDVPRNQRMTDASCDQCHGTGYVVSRDAIPVLANFHPSYLRRGKASHQGVFSRIIQRGLRIASGADRQFAWGVDPGDNATWNIGGQRLQYWTHPSLDQARSVLHYLRGNSALWIAKDIETSESGSLDEDAREGFSDTEVRLFQLSYQPGTGIAIPYTGEFRQVIRELLHLPNPAFGHHWDNFDHKVLRACAAREGWRYAPPVRVFDTLDMFHHWQPDLPAHLQFCASFVNFPFPWKHLAVSNIEFYGICDVDADLQLGTFLERQLKRDGLWGEGEAYSLTLGYTGQLREVRPVLAAMEDRGVPVDDARRIALGAEFDRAAQELLTGRDENGKHIPGIVERAPKECQRVHPKEGYKGLPPEVKQWFISHGTEPKNWIEHPINELQELHIQRFQEPDKTTKDGTVEEGEWYTYQRRTFKIPEVILDGSAGEPSVYDVEHERWCRVYDFNPNSSQQLIAYMKAKKHPVPKSKEEDDEGNQKDTTAAKELQRLAMRTGDDFYLKVIEYRGLTKMRGTYVDGFRPSADGCVHTTFTFDTGIGQLSSRNPNVQNFPKLKPTPALAKAMRGMIAARPGHVIVEIDYKSCHALTLGYLAESATWMRMARLDIHSIVAGHFLHLWDARDLLKQDDEWIRGRCMWLKSDPERKRVRDDQAKHGILGIGNGLKYKGLYERYMEQFPARACPACVATPGREQGVRGMRKCRVCEGTKLQSGLSIAQQVLDVCEEIAPEVFAWQRRMQDQAHRDQYLRTEFGHIRRFYEVFRWDSRKGSWGHGDQAEEAIAFWLANIAFGHIREGLKALDREGMAERYGMFNNVHDSYMFHCEERLLADCIADVIPVLRRPSAVLRNPKVAPGGLVIDVDASFGKDWGAMEEIKLPKVEFYDQTSMALAAPVQAPAAIAAD